jgi:hypothetical protein
MYYLVTNLADEFHEVSAFHKVSVKGETNILEIIQFVCFSYWLHALSPNMSNERFIWAPF